MFVCFYVSFPEQQASKERSNARFVYSRTQNDDMFALVYLVSGPVMYHLCWFHDNALVVSC